MSDSLFILTEQPQRTTNHIGMVFVFDPSSADEPVTYEKLLELYRDRLPLARVFREKLVRVPLDIDYPYWINDKDFDLEFHVRHSGIPRPGTRKQFFAVVNRIMSLELDMSRPLWETYLIEGLDEVEGMPAGSFALLFKMHHAAVDGVSGMEMVTALLETAEGAAARMPKEEWQGEEVPDQRKLLLQGLGSGWSGPLKLTGALVKSLPAMAAKRKKQRSGELIKPPKAKAPNTRFNQPGTPHKVLEGRSWPFAEVKRLKDGVPGATINDIVMTVVAGALRTYLESKKELPKESLIASVPISTRTEEKVGTGGNQVTLTFAKLHTEIADPLERLAAIGEGMRQIKEYHKSPDAQSLADTTAQMPGLLIGLAMRAVVLLPPSDAMRVSNTLVTNIPGPLSPMTLLGARYVCGFGAGPSMDGMGLVNIITSLSGVLSIGISACRELMPDPEFYAQAIEDSFNELRDLIDGQARAGTAEAGEVAKPSPAATTPPKRKAAAPRNAATPRKAAAPRKASAEGKAKVPGKPRSRAPVG